MRQNITIALQPESQPIHQHNTPAYAFVDSLNSKLVSVYAVADIGNLAFCSCINLAPVVISENI